MRIENRNEFTNTYFFYFSSEYMLLLRLEPQLTHSIDDPWAICELQINLMAMVNIKNGNGKNGGGGEYLGVANKSCGRIIGS